MREALITKAILRQLQAAGWPAYKTHGNPMELKGRPDIYACAPPLGTAVLIEVKVPGEVADPLQRYYIDLYRAAGAYAGVMNDLGQVRIMIVAFPHVCKRCFGLHDRKEWCEGYG